MTLTFTCPDCGATATAGKRCACFPPLPQPSKAGRRPKGSVKAAVLMAFDKRMTVPQAVKATGLNRYTIYNAATRLGLKLKAAR